MIVSIRELSSSILLYSPGTEVLSITIWELWENGQYVELSRWGAVYPGALRPGDARPVAWQEIRSQGMIRRIAC